MLAVSTTRVIVAAANTPRGGTRKVSAKKPAGKVRVVARGTTRPMGTDVGVGTAKEWRIGGRPSVVDRARSVTRAWRMCGAMRCTERRSMSSAVDERGRRARRLDPTRPDRWIVGSNVRPIERSDEDGWDGFRCRVYRVLASREPSNFVEKSG